MGNVVFVFGRPELAQRVNAAREKPVEEDVLNAIARVSDAVRVQTRGPEFARALCPQLAETRVARGARSVPLGIAAAASARATLHFLLRMIRRRRRRGVEIGYRSAGADGARDAARVRSEFGNDVAEEVVAHDVAVRTAEQSAQNGEVVVGGTIRAEQKRRAIISVSVQSSHLSASLLLIDIQQSSKC